MTKGLLDGIDIENIVALLRLTIICVVAMNKAGALPPVVNTIVGGIIGYMTRSFTTARKIN